MLFSASAVVGRIVLLILPVQCPARWRRCRNCQQKGHYAKFCKEAEKSTPRKQKKPKKVKAVEVLAVKSDNREDLWTELQVDNQQLRMMADTGSAVSTLPLSVYRKQFRHLPLLPTAVRLEAYGGSSLRVEGVVQATVQAENGNSRAGATDFGLEGQLVQKKGPWRKGPFFK